MRLVHVLGTRPNVVKMAPVIAAARERFGPAASVIVHTGQHYDRAMSEIFFEELGLPEPDHSLGVGSGTHAEQTAGVLERLEPVLRAERPDLVLVPGDVNSTLAAALCAARLGVAVAHSSPDCAASIARCPRRSTGSSSTTSPSCSSCTRPRPWTTCAPRASARTVAGSSATR